MAIEGSRLTARTVLARLWSRAPAALWRPMERWRSTKFWRGAKLREGALGNAHFEFAFTTLFGLERADFAGKTLLDIGCGPRGSLEWAGHALERVGVDPLADRYLKMGADKHAMRYVKAGCEAIPFEDGHFDIVTALNSLDHVENVDAAVAEIQRITRPGGDILIIVEVNHKPTITEPHFLERDFAARFVNCETVSTRVLKIREDHDVYRSIQDGIEEADPSAPAILIARLRRLEPTVH